MEDGPSKGLHDITLLSQDARLKGRPKLCSDCGLCDSSLRPIMPRTCVFVHNQVSDIEQRLFGRTRKDGDELLFGIYRTMYAARMRQPVPDAQWSGIVTSLAARLLEQGTVDAVITTRAVPGTRFAPQPILARTPAEVRASAGNKPCLAPSLSLLDDVRASGVKRLAFIGTGCQVHMLRAAEAELGLEQLYVIGIPCSDNVAYPDLQFFLSLISHSPDTIVHYEFMQDFSVWLRHEDGHSERVNFIDFPMDKLENIFPSACLSCFDYPNSMADLTVGYMGAALGWQWVMVRTERGEELFRQIAPELEFGELVDRGNRRKSMPRYIEMMKRKPGKPPALIRKLIVFLQRRRGPKGLEFARSVIEMKLLRNLQYIRTKFPRFEERAVPYHVYMALQAYAPVYQETFERPLEAKTATRADSPKPREQEVYS